MEGEQTVRTDSTQTGRVSLCGRCDAGLLAFGAGHPRLMLAARVIFQVASAAIAVFFGMALMQMVGVAGPQAFLDTAFAGLTLQTDSLAYANGTAAIVTLLMVLYGVFTCLFLGKARVFGDLAALYCLFFSLTLPVNQFEKIVAPALAVYLIWLLHRVVLGTIVFRYRALSAGRR